jgi:hypothetical protein
VSASNGAATATCGSRTTTTATAASSNDYVDSDACNDYGRRFDYAAMDVAECDIGHDRTRDWDRSC